MLSCDPAVDQHQHQLNTQHVLNDVLYHYCNLTCMTERSYSNLKYDIFLNLTKPRPLHNVNNSPDISFEVKCLSASFILKV